MVFLFTSIASSAVLTWQPNTDEDLQGYLVYYGKESGNYTTPIDVGNVTEYIFENLDEGKTYYFIITAYDRWGNESEATPEVTYTCACTSVDEEAYFYGPVEFTLAQNYPNPFNPETTIEFSVKESGDVTMMIFNSMGQKVRTLIDEQVSSGNQSYTVVWEGRNDSGALVSSGRYFYRIQQGNQSITKQMTFKK